MKKPIGKAAGLFDKAPIVGYVLISYVKALLIALAGFTVIFAGLYFTGIYAKIETALDLKYNSPIVLVLLWGCLGLAVVCFFVGFLMYFYKYKRSKSKNTFSAALAKVLGGK
jgi:hypothetical protein